MTQELRKLRKLAEKATPGYWSYVGREYADNGGTFETIEAETGTVIGEYSLSEKDARYISAASPAAIIELINRVEKAEKDAGRYRWLRDSEWEMFTDRWLCEHDIYGEGQDQLGAAIDTAMEASK